MLISVTESAAPHVVTVVIEVAGDRLVARVGPGTSSNLRVRPQLTLTWYPPAGGERLLILDGVAESVVAESDGSATITIRIERGILHRLASHPSSGPTCVPL